MTSMYVEVGTEEKDGEILWALGIESKDKEYRIVLNEDEFEELARVIHDALPYTNRK